MRRQARVFVLGLATLLPCSRATAAGGTDVAIGDLMKVKSITAVAISPDGSQVAYAIRELDPERYHWASAIWVASVDGARNRILTEGSGPQWAPDGAWISFLSSRSGSPQVWRARPHGGQPERLTDQKEGVKKFQWAPDGKKLAVLTEDPVRRKEGEPTVVDVNDLRMLRLSVVDLASKKARLLTPGNWSAGGYEQWFPDGFSWSPDSVGLAFSLRPHAKAGGHLYGDVATVGLNGGEPKRLVQRAGMDENPRWSPAGKQVAFISTGVYDWVKTSSLWVISSDGAELRNLTADFEESVKDYLWTGDGKKIYFIAGQGVGTQIFALDVGAAKLRRISRGADVYSHLSISRDGSRCAFVRENANTPPDVYVSSLDDFEPKRITEVNPQVAAWNPGTTEVIQWKSLDGMEIEGILHHPGQGAKHPLLVVPHGGPHGVFTNNFVAGRPALDLYLVQRGWVVFKPNFRGSGNYGERFLRANLNDWGFGDFKDIMTGVDRLIDRGLVDHARMAMMGTSYGGYMTSWTITQTNRFKAAGVGAGLPDLVSFVRMTDVPERFENYLGGDAKRYPRHSPLHYVENVKTPTLIWHGDQDQRVPLVQGRELYTALRKHSVPVEFVIYHGEGHGLSDPRHIRDALERQIRWLERWVLRAEVPSDGKE